MDHFVDAGVDGVWLSPIFTSPMVDFGYDISDFKDIDPAYGTIEDFTDMIKRAKELGIKVVIDFVPNHSSSENDWFEKSESGIGKYKNFYVWREGRNDNKSPPNNWISVFTGPAWTYSDKRQQWYLHQFERRQPDMNYDSPELRAEIGEVLNFWLEKGVDGFRIDAVPYIFEDPQFRDEPRSYAPGVTDEESNYLNHIYTKDDPRTYELISSWRKKLDDYASFTNSEEKLMMSEAYTSLANTTRFYESGVDVPFNFMLITELDKNSTSDDFKKVIDTWLKASPKNAVPNWVVGNHDRSRIASMYPGRADQMTMLAMILPGVAVTYYGDEIGMVDKRDISWEDTQDPQACLAGRDQYLSLSRDPNRTPFQWDDTENAGFSNASKTWLPVNSNYKELNLAKQKSAPESHYKIYQALTKLKKSSEALRNGSLKVATLNDKKVLGVFRETTGQTLVLLINFSNNDSQVVDLTKDGKFYKNSLVIIASLNSNVKVGNRMDPFKVNLPPKATLIIKSEE
ncbi:maltase 1-like [Prorops nasuta]|uniref:maltase 1-like n=1 Tax=Prorops nasuta TaxID=863751 RepID=UPI0034CE94F7